MSDRNDKESSKTRRDSNTNSLTDNNAYEEVYPREDMGRDDNVRHQPRSDNSAAPETPMRDYILQSSQRNPTPNHSIVQSRSDVPNTQDYSNLTSSGSMEGRNNEEKIREFKDNPEEFIDKFNQTKDEIRTAEETFIIMHLLAECDDRSPILDGQLDQLAMLACCNSSRVMKKALDVLLNEIFLCISDLSRDRCRNIMILKAEETLRLTFVELIKLDRYKAKCHRMTTYAWLVTLVLLKCSKEEFSSSMQSKIKEFDQSLNTLMKNKDNIERNLFRYGIHLARESIRRILQSCRKGVVKESLINNIKKCENLLKGKLDKNEVLQFGKELSEADGWLDMHVCLIFLQDLPKQYQFLENPRPVILLQMLVADYRERCSTRKFRDILRISNPGWLFEMLFYRVMLRLIRTSKNRVIIELILTGKQGCGGIFTNWEKDQSSTPVLDQFGAKHREQLCERAVFISPPKVIEGFLTGRSIEDLSILELSSKHRDKILEILQESRNEFSEQRFSTYDALVSGKKCLLKLYLHSKEEILGIESGVANRDPLREEIEILKILDGNPKPCENIVSLLGQSTKPPIHVIIERTTKSDLLTYLQDFTKPPQADVLLQIARDICKAMIYLGENGIIHRDLCAKNCFVFIPDPRENRPLIKLGGFHLAINPAKSSAETVNEYSQNQLSVRWTAVEALRDSEFSFASDVWSFGVLLFEIFTFGAKPYVNMTNGTSLEDDEVRAYVCNGQRLEPHPKMPDLIKKTIKSTMKTKASRPTFLELNSNLTEMTFADEIYMDPANYRKIHRIKTPRTK